DQCPFAAFVAAENGRRLFRVLLVDQRKPQPAFTLLLPQLTLGDLLEQLVGEGDDHLDACCFRGSANAEQGTFVRREERSVLHHESTKSTKEDAQRIASCYHPLRPSCLRG